MARTKFTKDKKSGKKKPPHRRESKEPSLEDLADFGLDDLEDVPTLIDDSMVDLSDFDFDDDTTLDEDDLWSAWVEQSNLRWRYGKAKAILNRITADAHEDLKVARSRIIKEYKEEEPSATGPMIEAHYRTHPIHKFLKKRLIKAEFNCSIMDAGLASIHDRREGLKDLVRLQLGDLYGEPGSVRLPDGQRFGRQLAEKKSTRKKIKGRLNKERD